MADSADIVTANQHNFEAEVLEESYRRPVLVDFWAPWCGPCRMLMPLLDKIVREANGVLKLAKVNTDEEMALAGMFGIRSLPTVVLFKDGRPVDGFMGAQPEGAIKAMLAKHLTAPAEAEADDLLDPAAEEDLDARIQAARELVRREPNKEEHQVALADLLAQAGEITEAEQILAKLSALAEGEGAKRVKARIHFSRVEADAPSERELQSRIAQDPHNLRARYLLGVKLLLAGQWRGALDQFLTILKTDRKFEDDLGRKALIDAFKLIDDEDLVGEYRRKMTSLLF
jgi:putative thioredoxin